MPTTNTPAGAFAFGQPAKDTKSQAGSLIFGQSAKDTQEPEKIFSFGSSAKDSPQQASPVTFGQTAKDTQQQAGSLIFGQPAKDKQKQASSFSFGSPAKDKEQANASQGNQASASFPPTGASSSTGFTASSFAPANASFDFAPAQPQFDYQKNPFKGEVRPSRDLYKDGFHGKIFQMPGTQGGQKKSEYQWLVEGNSTPQWAPMHEGPLIPTEPFLPPDYRLPGTPTYALDPKDHFKPKPTPPKLAPGIQLNASSKPEATEASSSTSRQPSALEQMKAITSGVTKKQQMVSDQWDELVDRSAQARSATKPTETQPQATSNIIGQPEASQQQSSQGPARSTPKPAPILTFAQAMKETQERAGVFSVNMPSTRTQEQREQQQSSQARAPSTPKPAETQPQAAGNIFGQSKQQQQQPTQAQAPSTPNPVEAPSQATNSVFGQSQQQPSQPQGPSTPKPAKAPSQPTSSVFAHLQQTGTLMPAEAQTPATNNIFGHLHEPKGPVRLHLNPPKPPAEPQSQAARTVFGQPKQQQPTQAQVLSNSEAAPQQSAQAQPLSDAKSTQQPSHDARSTLEQHQQPVEKRQEQPTNDVPTEQPQPPMPKQDSEKQQQKQPTSNVSSQLQKSKKPPSNVFGQQRKPTQPTINPFGQQPMPQQATSSLFGKQQEPKQPTSNAFGPQQEPQQPTNDFSGQQQESIQATSNAFSQHQEPQQPTNDFSGQQQESIQATSNAFGQHQEPQQPTNDFSGQQQESIQATSNAFGQHQEPQQPTNNVFHQQEESQQATSNAFGQHQEPQQPTNNVFHQQEESQQATSNLSGQHQEPQQPPYNSFGQQEESQQATSNLSGQHQEPQQPPYNSFGQQEQSKQATGSVFRQHHEPQQPMGNLFSQRSSELQEQNQPTSNVFAQQATNNLFAQQQEKKQSPNSLPSQHETNDTFFQQPQQPASNSFGQQQQPANDSIFSQPQQQSSSNSFGQQQQPANSSIFSQPQQQSGSNSFGQQQQSSSSIFSQPQLQSSSSMFGQQEQPANDSVFSQPQQQSSSSIFSQPQLQSSSSMFGQQEQPANNNIFSQPEQQSTSNMFSQQAQQPIGNMFGQLQSQPAGNLFGLPAQQNTSNMFGQLQPQPTSNIFAQQAQQSNGNIFGQMQSQQTGNVFDQQAYQPNGNVFSQLQSQPLNSFGQHPQQSNGDILGQVQQGMTSNLPEQQQYQRESNMFLQDGEQSTINIPQRNEDQQHQQDFPFTSMSLNQSPPTEPEPFRRESNPFLASLDTFMEHMDTGEPLDGIDAEDEEMDNENPQAPTDAEDEQMLSPIPSPERRRADNQDQVMSDSGKETLSPNTGGLASQMRHAINNPDQHQIIQQHSGNSTLGGKMAKTSPQWFTASPAHGTQNNAAQDNTTQNNTTQNHATQKTWVQTPPTQNNTAKESDTGRQIGKQPVTSFGPASLFSTVNVQSTSQPSPSPILPALPSVTRSISSRLDVAAAPSNQGEKLTPSPSSSTRFPASLSQPSQPSAHTRVREFGKQPVIPVDFIDQEKRQFNTAWRLRFVEVGLHKRFRYKRSAADMGTAIKYFEFRKRIILAANGGNMPRLAGSKRKAGNEQPTYQKDHSDEPRQKRSKSIHLPNGTSPAQVAPVNDSQPAQVVGAHKRGRVDGNPATKEADKGKMTEKRKAGEELERFDPINGKKARFEEPLQTLKRKSSEELSREESDNCKKPRIDDQSETSNMFKDIVGKKNDANTVQSTALNNGLASFKAPLESDKPISHTLKPAESTLPKSGTVASIQRAPNTSEPPAFKIPTFNTGSSANWTAQFGKTATKSAEQLAKEEKAKRKAEEFDSDEDDEAQWERDYEERLRAKRQKAEAVKAKGTTKLVNGKFVFVSSDDAVDTEATQDKPHERYDSILGQSLARRNESVLNQKNVPPPNGQNIFGSLPGGQNIIGFKRGGQNIRANSGSRNIIRKVSSGNESVAEDSRTGDADDEGDDGHGGDDGGETDDSQDKSQAIDLKAPKIPIGSQSSHSATPQPSQITTATPKQSSLGGLFDRVAKDKEGNLIRETPNTPNVLLPTDSAAVKKAPFGSLQFDWTSKEKADTPVESSKDDEGRIDDHTWKPYSPIKFGVSGSPPTVNVTSPSPSKQPFTGLFGVSKTNNTVETPVQPVSVLSSSTPQKTPSVGFNFGFTPANSIVTSLAPPSNEVSAVTSRATTPGVTTGESANESTADAQGEEDDEAKDRQIDLTAGGPGEEHEDVAFEVKGKAMVYDRSSSKWDVKGVGFLRVLKNRDTGKTRMLMRQDPSGKILLNTALAHQFNYASNQSKHVRLPFANESGKIEAWMLRVGKDEDAKRLVAVLEENKSN